MHATMSPDTLDSMPAERPRMIFDCSERLRRAIKIKAAKEGIGTSELIASLVEQHLAIELQQAEESLKEQQPKPKKK